MDGPRSQQEQVPAAPGVQLERRAHPAPRRFAWHGAALLTAALLAVASGAAYLWQWQLGLRGVDLLRFVSLYLCLPLAASLLLLFAALQQRRRG